MPSKPKKPASPKKQKQPAQTETAPEAQPAHSTPVVRVEFGEPEPAAPAPKIRFEDLRTASEVEAAPRPKPLPRLDGKRILIVDGTDDLGFRLTALCLATGATVIVPSTSEERLKALRGKLTDAVVDRLVPIVGTVEELVPKLGRLDGVVASLGGFWEGPQPSRVSVEDWKRIVDHNLTTHFVLARTLIPVLHAGAKGGSYVIVNGPWGEAPPIRSAPVAVAAAGLSMLARVLGDELSGTGVVLEELIYSSARERAHWLSLDGLMREVLRILATRTRTH